VPDSNDDDDDDANFEGGEFEIFVRPFYAVAVVDIIRHYRWQDIWYIYSSDEGLSMSGGMTQKARAKSEISFGDVYTSVYMADNFH